MDSDDDPTTDDPFPPASGRLLPIGAFGRVSRLSAKALRLYADNGLPPRQRRAARDPRGATSRTPDHSGAALTVLV